MANYPISNVPRRVQYVNTGVGPYLFNFEILTQTDIAVYRGNTLLTLTTDYTVTINGNGTGSVTLVTAGTGNITIVGARAIQRTSDYTTNGDLFANTLNTDLDSQTIYSQQLAENLDRTITVPITDASTLDMELPVSATRANKVFGFDSNGEPQVTTNTLAAIDAAVDTLESIASSSPGSSAGISHIAAGTGAVPTTAQNKLRERVSVKDFGAVGNGVTDDSAAIRLALDYAAALTRRCEIFFPPGTYYVPTTVFLPKFGGGNRGGALTLSGYGATIKGAGAGTGVIFETGAQEFSTGGTSNWGFPEAHLHYGTIIEGFYFQECHTALKLYNFLEGSRVQNCAGYNLITFIYASRCFYGDFINNRGGSNLTYTNPGSYAIDDAVFKFTDFVNVQSIDGNSAVYGKTGFYFGQGISGLMCSNNSAEICHKGLVIQGAVYGAQFFGWYLEGNGRDIEVSDGNAKASLFIDGFWCTSSDLLYAETWTSGEFGKNMFNYSGGSITATNNLNQFHIWLPRTSAETGVEYGQNVIPANWTLNDSVMVHTQETRYVAASGPSNVRYGLAENYIGGNDLMVPRYYVGTSNLRWGVPYCSVNTATFGDAVIDTKIRYDIYEGGVRFDLTVLHNVGTTRLAGWIIGTTVFRDDPASQTITASDNGGFYRISITGFSTASAVSVLGGVRIL